MVSSVSLELLTSFHNIDRQVYAILVIDLGLDPNLSKKIVAFWYWLEKKGYKDFINKVLLLSRAELNCLAMEAVTCLDCLYLGCYITTSSFHIDAYITLPVMCILVTQDFSLGELYADRTNGIITMERFVKDVCDRIFFDIEPRNLVNGFHITPALADWFQIPPGFQIQPVMANGFQVQSMEANGVDQVQPIVWHAKEAQVDYFPHRDNENEYHSKMVAGEENNATLDLSDVSNITDRTLFITFSKGHPISKEELRDLIERTFGTCVEAVHMRVDPEPLFARVVVNSVSVMAEILGDKDIVKLSTNGKDVRVRRFIPNTNQVSSSNALM